MLVVSTATTGGQDSAVFQNVGSAQGITNAAVGATVNANAWIAILPPFLTSLVDATTDSSAFSLIGNAAGKVKLIKIPAWLGPVDTGNELQITAPPPTGSGNMNTATYDILSGNIAGTPAAQVDQARILISPKVNLFRNFLDNATFKVCQKISRSTSLITAVSGFQVDRWQYVTAGSPSGVFSINVFDLLANSTGSFPAGEINPLYVGYTRFTVSTAATPAAADRYLYQQGIETFDARALIANSSGIWNYLVVRIYGNFPAAGNLGVSLYNPLANKSCVLDLAISSGGSYVEYVGLFPMPSINDSWNFSTFGVAGLYLRFSLGAGANFRCTTPQIGTWVSGDYQATPNSTDWIAGTSSSASYFMLPSLNAGRQPIMYWDPPFSQELAQAQRFFNMSSPYGSAPGGGGSLNGQLAFSNPGSSTTVAQGNCPFPVRMAKSPSVLIYDPTTGTSGAAHNAGNSTQATGITAVNVNDRGFGSIAGTGIQTASSVFFHYGASCEI
jgi:hypothetical protein